MLYFTVKCLYNKNGKAINIYFLNSQFWSLMFNSFSDKISLKCAVGRAPNICVQPTPHFCTIPKWHYPVSMFYVTQSWSECRTNGLLGCVFYSKNSDPSLVFSYVMGIDMIGFKCTDFVLPWQKEKAQQSLWSIGQGRLHDFCSLISFKKHRTVRGETKILIPHDNNNSAIILKHCLEFNATKQYPFWLRVKAWEIIPHVIWLFSGAL